MTREQISKNIEAKIEAKYGNNLTGEQYLTMLREIKTQTEHVVSNQLIDLEFEATI